MRLARLKLFLEVAASVPSETRRIHVSLQIAHHAERGNRPEAARDHFGSTGAFPGELNLRLIAPGRTRQLQIALWQREAKGNAKLKVICAVCVARGFEEQDFSPKDVCAKWKGRSGKRCGPA